MMYILYIDSMGVPCTCNMFISFHAFFKLKPSESKIGGKKIEFDAPSLMNLPEYPHVP